MKVLVIGGTGPSGPPVVNGLLERGHTVAILHTGTHETDFSGHVEHFHGDPNFKESLDETIGNRSFDLVIAMYGRIRFEAEVMKRRTSRFIAVTGCVYQEGARQPIPETAPLKKEPKFFRQIELTEQLIMENHKSGEYSATILRFPSVYGPRQTIPQDYSIVKRILDGRKQFIIPDSGLVFSSMGFSENVAHAMLRAIDRPEECSGQIYNVRDDTQLTFRQRVELIAKIMNYELELVNMPFMLARPTWPCVTAVRWFDTEHFHFMEHRLTDISKIKTQLGYRDIVSPEEGIGQTVKWLIENPPNIEEYSSKSGDRFNYAAEDNLIQMYREFYGKAKDIPFDVRYVHSYEHPKTPGQKESWKEAIKNLL